MLYFALKILLCFFAILGVFFSVRAAADFFTLRRAGLILRLSVMNISSKDAVRREYALRILESVLSHGSLRDVTDRIVLYGVTDSDAEVFEKLQAEFGNLLIEKTADERENN